jgi:XTP/dITP diphosphohydrolase
MDVVVASNNAGKLAELTALLSPLGVRLSTQRQLRIEEADETATTFVENALIKARHAAAATGMPAIADDSGLVVAALGGAPGVRSARYAGSPSDGDANNR